MYGEFSQGNLKRWEIIVENTHVRKLTQLADFKDAIVKLRLSVHIGDLFEAKH